MHFFGFRQDWIVNDGLKPSSNNRGQALRDCYLGCTGTCKCM